MYRENPIEVESGEVFEQHAGRTPRQIQWLIEQSLVTSKAIQRFRGRKE